MLLTESWLCTCVCAFHPACSYNISCYSSLLQQADATADAELVFQQRSTSKAVAQTLVAPYGALWLHPDDLQHLQQLQSQQAASVGGSMASGVETGRPSFAAGMQGARASVLGLGMARCVTSLQYRLANKPAAPPTLHLCRGGKKG